MMQFGYWKAGCRIAGKAPCGMNDTENGALRIGPLLVSIWEPIKIEGTYW